jgi:hypothetical protein
MTINCSTLRKYFVSMYSEKFYADYKTSRITVEMILLKRLLNEYSPYLILEAMDEFISKTPVSKISILYFASKKVFPERFKNLIRLKAVIDYQRLLPLYSEQDQATIRRLIQDYKNYAAAISLSQEDIDRKKEIIDILGSLKYAEGDRSSVTIFD